MQHAYWTFGKGKFDINTLDDFDPENVPNNLANGLKKIVKQKLMCNCYIVDEDENKGCKVDDKLGQSDSKIALVDYQNPKHVRV